MLTIPDLYAKAHKGDYDEGKGSFYEDAEEAFDFKDFPSKVKSRIHSIAYEDGHAAGYGDMVTQYFNLVELVRLTLIEGSRGPTA